MIGPNEANEKKGINPSDRIFVVRAVDRNAAILEDLRLIDSAGTNRTLLLWKGQVRFYDAEHLVRQLRNEATAPAPPNPRRERQMLELFDVGINDPSRMFGRRPRA